MHSLNTRLDLSRQIDLVLQRLDLGLIPTDEANGWTELSRQRTREFLDRLRQRLGDSRPLAPDERPVSLSRQLDHLGVIGGDLLEMVARISQLLRKVA